MGSRVLLLCAGTVVGALAYAALAIGSGLDRLAPIRPAVARHVPALLATNALEVAAETSLRGDPRAAAGWAERLVARAPIEPFSTALLGAGRAAQGDDAGADRAFRVAGQLGWRVPLTQSYWLTAALAAGDARIAAQRLDALLRQRPELLRSPEVTAPFERDAARRGALIDQLVTRPPWLDAYAGATDPASPGGLIAPRVPVLMMLADRGVVLGCTVISPAVNQLAAAGMAGAADALRLRHCRFRQ